MQVYTSTQWPHYVLGVRCSKGHSGNRRFGLDRDAFGRPVMECYGCGNFRTPPQFQSRAEAEAADRQFRARWPEDSAEDVLAGRRI